MALLWVLTLAVMGYALFEEWSEDTLETQSDDGDSDGENDADKLRIVSAKPLEPSPGAAVIVKVGGQVQHDRWPLMVEISKTPAEVLHHEGDQLVVRVPPNLPHGQAKLRVLQGDRKSKPWVLTLRPLPLPTIRCYFS